MSAKIAARYRRDRPAIVRAMGVDPGPIAAIEPGWGDPHRGGQTVSLVRFKTGCKLGYKPRSMAPELLWATVVKTVERHLALGLQAPRVANCQTHGWVEWIRAEPGALVPVAALRRTGAAVALLDLLEVRDAHPDNFALARGQPILIDAETVGHPRLRGFEPVPSIILTGALPWPPGARHPAILSALATSPRREAAIVAGYRAVHRLFRQRGRGWLRPAGMLGRFRRTRVRAVLRPTRDYHGALQAGREHLPPPLGIVDREAAARVLASERRALARGDIPLFEVDLDGVDLRDERRVIVPGFFTRSGWSVITGRLARLEPGDANGALGLLRSCLRLDQASRRRR